MQFLVSGGEIRNGKWASQDLWHALFLQVNLNYKFDVLETRNIVQSIASLTSCKIVLAFERASFACL